MDAARHEVVAGAFRGAAGEDRGLVFGESEVPHLAAQGFDELGAHHDVVVEVFAAEVQEAVFEAERFRRVLVLRDQERQLFGLAEHGHLIGHEFDLAGRDLRVHGLRRAGDDFAREAHDRLHAPAFEFLIEILGRVDHDLRLAVVVAQVDEDDAAVVAHAVDPAGKACSDSDVAFSQFAAGMRSELMHDSFSVVSEWVEKTEKHGR